MKILDKPYLILRHSRIVSSNSQAISSPVFPAQIENPQSHDERGLFAPGNRVNPGGRPQSKVFRKLFKRHLRLPDGEVMRADRVVSNIIDMASEPGKGAVAAFEAIRDTVDGRPSPDSEGATGQSIIVNTVFIGDDND